MRNIQERFRTSPDVNKESQPDRSDLWDRWFSNIIAVSGPIIRSPMIGTALLGFGPYPGTAMMKYNRIRWQDSEVFLLDLELYGVFLCLNQQGLNGVWNGTILLITLKRYYFSFYLPLSPFYLLLWLFYPSSTFFSWKSTDHAATWLEHPSWWDLRTPHFSTPACGHFPTPACGSFPTPASGSFPRFFRRLYSRLSIRDGNPIIPS